MQGFYEKIKYYLYIIYLIMLFRSVVMGKQVYGAIKVKAEGQQEMSAHSMVTGNTNLMSGLENRCH